MRRIVLFILLIAMITVFIPAGTIASGYAAADFPDSVRVGLYYNSTAANAVDIGCDGGLDISVHQSDTFGKLMTMAGGDTLQVVKDGYYTFSGGAYSRMETSQGAQAGPYHLQVSSCNSADDAGREADSLRSQGYDAYPAYDGGYKVWVGSFLDASGAAQSGLDGDVVDGTKDTILVKRNGETVLAVVSDKNDELYFKPLSGNLSIAGKSYRGAVSFKRNSSSDMTVINILPLEEYLYGVIPNEMPPAWPQEALKAQAVAARTYAVYNIINNGKFASLGFDVGCSTDSQVYKGKSTESAAANKAVDMTKGILMLHDGVPVEAFFYSHSGGYTADISDIYNSSSPVFVGKADPYSLGYAPQYDGWSVTFSAADLLNKLMPTKGNIGNIDSVDMTHSYTGRVLEMDINGTNGSAVMKKNETRSVLGLKSTLFDMDTDSDVYTLDSAGQIKKSMPRDLFIIGGSGVNEFTGGNLYSMGNGAMKEIPGSPSLFTINGSGYGHGIGLSQYGARGMADKGFNYTDILEYYYSNIEVYDTINGRNI